MTDYLVQCRSTGEAFQCGGDRPLLIAMERQAMKLIRVGCRGGGCGRCRIRIVSGAFDTKKMSKKCIGDDALKNNITLACRTYPRSDIVFELCPMPENM